MTNSKYGIRTRKLYYQGTLNVSENWFWRVFEGENGYYETFNTKEEANDVLKKLNSRTICLSHGQYSEENKVMKYKTFKKDCNIE